VDSLSATPFHLFTLTNRKGVLARLRPGLNSLKRAFFEGYMPGGGRVSISGGLSSRGGGDRGGREGESGGGVAKGLFDSSSQLKKSNSSILIALLALIQCASIDLKSFN
jgi:hypothetical protein